MAWETSDEVDESGRSCTYAWDAEKGEDTRVMVYRQDHQAQLIEYFPKGEYVVPVVRLEGFNTLPDEFNGLGYMKSGMEYYINKKLSDFTVTSLVISKTDPSSIRKNRNADSYRVVISITDLRALRQGLTLIDNEKREERSAFADDHFSSTFPNKFKAGANDTARKRATRVMRNLDQSIIERLEPAEVVNLLDFFAALLDKKYTSAAHRQKLFRAAKVEVDNVALRDVIATFEKHLAEDVAESIWGKFLRENLFLVESKYVAVVPELSVMRAHARRSRPVRR